MNKYSVILKWSDEDGGFIAAVPELEGLSAFGETQEEALRELETATNAYLEAWPIRERPLPPPEKMSSYSGQLRLRMPRGLHARLAQSATAQGVSLNTYLVSLLSEGQGEAEAVINFREVLESMATSARQALVKTASNHPKVERRSPAGLADAVKEKKGVYKRKRASSIP